MPFKDLPIRKDYKVDSIVYWASYLFNIHSVSASYSNIELIIVFPCIFGSFKCSSLLEILHDSANWNWKSQPIKGQLMSKCLFEKSFGPTKNLIDSAQQV